ncbi:MULTISPECIES: hypothetical protein [Cysteiniphilum]|uniref:hypothetical protein n=1 Tax=Cysteiniphilum TaxID=2056696 RepID=UPI00177D3C82|nr:MULTISPECIES: hypothetical protein [Cysteiniphilum]
MANKKKTKTRNKSGKITAWLCHLRCKFTKPDDANIYIERCSIKVGLSNLKQAKETMDLHHAVVDWIEDLKSENGYHKDIELKVERWEPIR